MKRIVFFGLMLSLVLLAANTLEPAFADERLSGTGEWRSLSGEAIRGTWTVQLVRTGERIGGTMAVTGSRLLSDLVVSGTISDNQIALGTADNETGAATFSGRIVGETISGEWSVSALADEGVWSGTLK